MGLVLVTAPAAEPLTATEAKPRLGVGTEVADATMGAFIKAARQTIDGRDGWLGRALITQTWDWILPGFYDPRYADRKPSFWSGLHATELKIPLPPTLSITYVKYYDEDGVLQTMSSSDYRIMPGLSSSLMPLVDEYWPDHRCQDDAVTIRFVAGYGPAGSDVPEPIRSAIALMVSNLRSLSGRNLFVSAETEDGIGSTSYIVGTNAGQAIDAAVNSLLSTYRVFS